MKKVDFISIKNKDIEQLKAGKPLLGKDGAFATLLESILNAALKGEMDTHLTEEEHVLYSRIDKEITKIVKHKLGMLYVKEIICPQYALKGSTQLPPEEQKDMEIAHPLMPVNKYITDTSLLAEILLPKYEYHTPFYRQIQ